MAGQPNRSGGHNRRSVEAHLLAGTYRPDRHAHLTGLPAAAPVSAADRRRVLAGLSGTARRVALRLMHEFDGWNGASLEVLRNFALSAGRLEVLQAGPGEDTRGLHRELRANLALLRQLDLED